MKNSYHHSATAGTFIVKNGSGYLHTLVINTTAAGTITLYDNTAGSGQVIAILQASSGVGTYYYGLAFVTGLTIVAAAASDVTVSYT